MRSLIDDGFLESIGVTAVPVAAPAAAAVPTPAASPAPAAPVAAAKPPPAVSEQLKREVVRSLNDLLGPLAEGVAIKVERARTPEELRGVLEQAHRIIRDMRGAFQATAFADRFLSSETT
jgi:sugar phosphate isomerase/epimerase